MNQADDWNVMFNAAAFCCCCCCCCMLFVLYHQKSFCFGMAYGVGVRCYCPLLLSSYMFYFCRCCYIALAFYFVTAPTNCDDMVSGHLSNSCVMCAGMGGERRRI